LTFPSASNLRPADSASAIPSSPEPHTTSR